jgi:hypothetical protein
VLIRVAVIAGAAAVLAGAASARPAGTIAQPLPLATLQAETTAFNQHKWPAAYSAYTAKYRAKCPYATFAKKNAAIAKQFSGPLSVRMKSTKVTGSKAWLVYTVVFRGKVVASTAGHPDLFTRIGGLWYDDYEGSTVCD